MSFRCPTCKGKALATETRTEEGIGVERRYRCRDANCATGFSTFEFIREDSIATGDRRKLALRHKRSQDETTAAR